MPTVAYADNGDIARLAASLDNAEKALRREIGIVLGKTSKATIRFIKQGIQSEVVVTAKRLPASLIYAKRERDASTGRVQDVTVYVHRDKRIPVYAFRWRMASVRGKYGGGATYKISKKGKDRGHVPGAFLVKKWNKPMVRKGKERGPIRMLNGPSIWAVFLKSGYNSKTVDFIDDRIKYEFGLRIRFQNLKRSGQI